MDVAVVRSSDAGVVERAAEADTVPVINGGSRDDHPTQALADIYTLSRELGRVDGLTMGIVGRLEHRNVSALLRALALFKGVKVIAVPFSGQVDPEVQALCEERGMAFATGESVDALTEADAIYLNGPRTLAHVQLLRSRNSFNLRIDEQFLSRLQAHCVVLDPMQRSGDFVVSTEDKRLSYYRQAENSLFVRMGVLSQMLG
jgi:aspartate carbamoyltransferase catalytic subunit